MKKPVDWGAWLSMAAVVAVCVAIAVRLAPGSPDAEPTAVAPDVRKAEAAPVNKADKADNVEPAAVAPEVAEPARSTATDAGVAEAAPQQAGYHLNTPDGTLTLGKNLNEISGLSASSDPNSLWAVHDERGTLFRLSIKDGSVLQEIDLGKRGDYEGVEEAEGHVYVARSEGVLFDVDPKGGGEPKKLTFHSELGLACDLEGLAYQQKLKRLLLTCKNEGSKSRRSNKAFEVYAMPLESKKVPREPAYVLDEKTIEEYIAAHPGQADLKGAKGKSFAPSGISVHPQTGEIYLVSTRGKMVVVLDEKGTLVRAYGLDPVVHAQPEGITITPDGTLFISNEAHGKQALIHRFSFKEAARP